MTIVSIRPPGGRKGTLVGAPLVTPGAGTAQRNLPRMEFRPQMGTRVRPRRTAASRPQMANPARHPGDMNVAPTWLDRGGKRGGATCDARCRRGTTESVREWNYAANGNTGICPQMANPARYPGDMNVAPTWADCAKPRWGATCDARCRNGTMESVRKRNYAANGEPRHSPALANPTRYPGDMNVAPTWADRGEKRLQRE